MNPAKRKLNAVLRVLTVSITFMARKNKSQKSLPKRRAK